MNSLSGETIDSPVGLAVPAPCLPVQGMYVPEHELAQTVSALSGNVMAVVTFGDTRFAEGSDYLRIPVPAQQLGDEPMAEIWFSDKPCQSGKSGRIAFVSNETILFGAVTVEVDPATTLLDDLVESLYDEIDALVLKEGYPHFHRIWNYIPFINAEPGGLENYRRFSVGRHNALIKDRISFTNDLPAASALGITKNEFIVFFIAGKSPGFQIENPRQVNAYLYPKEYGPRSPSFARAKLVKWDRGVAFYISGTASIIGHETVHEDSDTDQLLETITNIEILIEQAIAEVGSFNLHDLTMLKVYLRNPALVSEVRTILQQKLGTGVPVVYLQADVCRTDLLLEVEAVYQACRP